MYPTWANQAKASSGVMASIARHTASCSVSWVRAPRPGRMALSLEKACSMGAQAEETIGIVVHSSRRCSSHRASSGGCARTAPRWSLGTGWD